MSVPRRDFMKILGISLGSLLLARCRRMMTPEPTVFMTCYQPARNPDPTNTPTPAVPSARDALRLCWLRFGELAEKTREGTNIGPDGGDPLGARMTADHRAALDELIAGGEITSAVADLIQEAYDAAVFHIWRSNAAMTCYVAIPVDYKPASADNLVYQMDALNQAASGGTIEPETVAKIRKALEHDLAFYALTDADVRALYDRLIGEYREPGETLPSFETVELTLSPEVKAAAQFLLDILMKAG